MSLANNNGIPFEDWFTLFSSHVRHLGYNGPIDQDRAKADYEADFDDEAAAQSFVAEMNK